MKSLKDSFEEIRGRNKVVTTRIAVFLPSVLYKLMKWMRVNSDLVETQEKMWKYKIF